MDDPDAVRSPDRTDPLPVVTPTPVAMAWLGPDVAVPASVTIAPADGADEAAVDAVTEVLQQSGAQEIVVRAQDDGGGEGGDDGGEAEDEGGRGDQDGGLVVHVGPLDATPVADALAAALPSPPAPADVPAEGYVLAVSSRDDGSAAGRARRRRRGGHVLRRPDPPPARRRRAPSPACR